jgi:adenine deaminase
VIVDVSTWDCPGKALQADPKKFITMIREGVVDSVSTDFAGGEWEPILKGMAMAIKAEAVCVAAAVALATGNIVRILPEIAQGKGLIAPGKVADLVMTQEEDISRVRDVIVNGKFVVKSGQLIYRH